MRRAFLRTSAVASFVLGALAGCHGDDPGQAASLEGSAAPLEVTSTPRGGELLRHTRREFPKSPFLAKPGVEGFQRVGEMFRAVTQSPRGKIALTRVELPGFADEAARVVSGGVELSIKPALAHASLEWAQDFAIHPEVSPGVTLFRRVDAEGLDDVYEVTSPRDSLAFTYSISMRGAGGLRLVEDTLEVLDRDGAPRLRMPAPIVADAKGVRRVGHIEVRGCAVDRDARGPWGRPLTPAGAEQCTVVASLDGRGLAYPVLVDPAWVGTGNTKRSHAFHKMLKLTAGADAGKVLLLGGTGSGPTDTELFDATTMTWAVSSALPDGLGQGTNAAVLPSGVVLIAGGFPTTSGTAAKSNSYVRSVTTGTWSSAATMAVGRAWFSMVPTNIDGKDVVFVAGGVSSTSTSAKPLKTAEYYEPTTDSWFTAASMSAERSHAGYTALSDGRVMVVGGHGLDAGGYVTEIKSVESYSPSTKTWTTGSSLGTERSDGAVLALPGGKAIITGGWNETDYTLPSVEYFDGSTWASILGKGMSEPRMYHASALLADGRILVAGGNIEPDDPYWYMTATATSEIITLGSDPKTTASIASSGNMAYVRIGPAAVVTDKGVLVTGGMTTDVDGSETTSSELLDTTIGASCSTGSPCPTGLFCTEGVCCKSASCPEGQTCAAPGSEGVCTKPKGSGCTSNAECSTGFCVTGVCCTTACAGDCETCNVKGSEGTCTSAAVGTDPKGKCGGDPTCGPFCDSFGDCYEYAPDGIKCGASLGDAGTGAFCTSYACDFGDCLKTTSNCGLTCTTSVSCDEATKTCTASATGIKAGQCVIDGQCWAYGDVNPKDACQLCDPPASKTGWSTAPSCMDGGTDTGTTEEDTGTSVEDTGTPVVDTGTPVDDTGTAEDASTETDASTGPTPLPEASTCGCELPGRTRTTAPFTALGLALGLVAVRRRRR